MFGLPAINRLPEGHTADTVLVITVGCVLGSALVHGMGARPATRLRTVGV
ncbi:hypothetical protein [Kutzneria sp. NPDC052558]